MNELLLRVARPLARRPRGAWLTLLAVGAATAACSEGSSPAPVASIASARSVAAAPSAPRAHTDYEPAFVEGTPGSECKLHPEGVSDPREAIPVGIDEDGVARFHVVRPTRPGDVTRMALDCVDPAGRTATYAVDLESEATFSARPFDASRTDLEPRPGLTGDPLALTQDELIRRGYGLRPDPTSSPGAYARWLAAARVSAHKLRMAPRATTAKAAPASTPGYHPDTSTTSIPAEWPGWTGAVMTGEYSQGATSAQSVTYAANEAQFTVPSVNRNEWGIGGTYVSIWNGLGQNANQLFQNEVWVYSTSSATSYQIANQVFSARGQTQVGNAGGGTRFTPSPGDDIYSEIWYCDAQGNLNIAGGYACLSMTDSPSGAVWICDQANSSTCSSIAINPAYMANGIIGTSAEFIIENDGSEASYAQGLWPQFTAPVTMVGSALVMTGATTQGPWVGVDTDPYVDVLQDFTAASNPDHIGIALEAPERVVWTVTQAPARATQTAPGCSYQASNTNEPTTLGIAATCTFDAESDPIFVYQQVNGGWQLVDTAATPSTPASFSIARTAGGTATFLACASPTNPNTWPVAPADIGCDGAPTTVGLPGAVVGSPCGTAEGYIVDSNGNCSGVGSSCGASSVIDDMGYCVEVGSGCAINGDAPGVWSAGGECVIQNITCPPGEAVAGPPGGEYCYVPSTGSSSGSGGHVIGGSGGGGSGGVGSSGGGCPRCPKIQ